MKQNYGFAVTPPIAYSLPTGDSSEESERPEHLLNTSSYFENYYVADQQNIAYMYSAYGYEQAGRLEVCPATAVHDVGVDVATSQPSSKKNNYTTSVNRSFQALWSQKLLSDLGSKLSSTLGKDGASEFNEEVKVRLEIGAAAVSFAERAEKLGKIIIEELHLPLHRKTFKPLQGDHGVAGGQKYCVEGIYFKFALDCFGVYGGNDKAAKAAGIELRQGLSQIAYLLIRGSVSNLRFPLQTLITYRGYRLVASALLPIDKSTLVFGSSDGGKTFQCTDMEAQAVSKSLGQHLNLAAHQIAGFTWHMAADVEIHRGTDGLLYILDTHRVFPPLKPGADKRSFLYRLMRPEFVRSYPKPLSSDGFCGWLRGRNKKSLEKNLSEATKHIQSVLVPTVAVALEREWNLDPALTGRQLTIFIHRHGVNMFMLGFLHSHCESPGLQSLLLSEMISRTAKHQIGAKLRSNFGSETDSLIKICRQFFQDMNISQFKQDLESRFAYEINPTDMLDRDYVKDRASYLLGLQDDTLVPRTRNLFLVEFYRAYTGYWQNNKNEFKWCTEKGLKAVESYWRALEDLTQDCLIMNNLAVTLKNLGEETGDESYYRQAARLLRWADEVTNGEHMETQLNSGVLYFTMNDGTQALHYFMKAYDLNSSDDSVTCVIQTLQRFSPEKTSEILEWSSRLKNKEQPAFDQTLPAHQYSQVAMQVQVPPRSDFRRRSISGGSMSSNVFRMKRGGNFPQRK